MGRKNNTAVEMESAWVGKGTTPGEWGETLGDARPSEWPPIPTEWRGRRGPQGLPSGEKPREGPPMSERGGRVVPG